MYRNLLVFSALLLSVAIGLQDVQAQDCPQLVQDAYNVTLAACDSLGDDEACYGNVTITVDPETLDFDQSGDLVSVDRIEGLRLSSMNVAAQEWGISLMRVVALSSDEVPQTVELVLFGNVEVENTATEDDAYTPMQAFTFRSAIDDRPCDEAPDSGLLIQTPAGVGEIAMLVNEVRIDLQSTVYLQAEPDGEMVVYVIEGEVEVTAQGTSITVPAGALATIPLDVNGLASGPPQGPEPYDASPLQALPVPLLANQVAIAEPASVEGSTSSAGGDGSSASTGELQDGFYMVDLVCTGDFPIETEAPAEVTFADDLSSLTLNFALLTAFFGWDAVELAQIDDQTYEFVLAEEFDVLGDGTPDGIETTVITADFAANTDVTFEYDYSTDDGDYHTSCIGTGAYAGTEIPAPTGSGLAPIAGMWNTSDSCEEGEAYQTQIADIGDGQISVTFDEDDEIIFAATDTGLYLATTSGGEDISELGVYLDFPMVEDDSMEAVLFALGTECVYTFTR